jgi:DNA-binding NarL/FixJ family response regulator
VPDNPSIEEVPYRAILTSIVKRFVRLVGAPAALNVARKIPNLVVDEEGNVQAYDTGDPLGTITALVEGYGFVFGEVALALSRQAAQPIVATTDENLLKETGLVTSTMPTIEILLVDDHVLFREGLVSLLTPQPDIKVVGQASSVREAITLARTLKPNLILMDISLPDGTGLEATQAILADRPDTKILILSVHEDDDRLFGAIRAGALGFLSKDARAAELLNGLRNVARGEAGLSPAIARRILEEFSRTWTPPQAAPAETTELTTRELEIVHELARGATNREIAEKFVISENTVKNHVHNVMSKLRLRSRRDIAHYARERGLSPRSSNSSKSS